MSTTMGRARALPQWLELREPADAEARSLELVEELEPHLPTGRRVVVHDLGCGTGSMGRWLAGRLSGPQHWVLRDQDAALLAVAASNPPARASDGSPVTVEVRRADITRLEPEEVMGADLITASALLDVMTADELDRFASTAASAGCPVLVTLTVTGHVKLSPSHPFDRRVADAFNTHQRRSTDAGRLLGPGAADAAVAAFTRRGLEVLARSSPWLLGPERSALAAEWFTGWLGAACEQQPELGAEADAYAQQRLAEAAACRLAVTVDHQDLLARPR